MTQHEYKLTPEMTPDDTANGLAIRKLRSEAGVQQKVLAESLDISGPYLSDMENGKRSFSFPLFNRAKVAILKHRNNGK